MENNRKDTLPKDYRMNIYEMGIERGIEKGIEIGLIKTLIQLVKQNLLSIPDAAKNANMSEEEFMNKMEEMENGGD